MEEQTKPKRRWFRPVAAVVAVVLVVGLCAAGWLLWQHHEDTQAGRECTQARATALKARRDYESLLAGKQIKEAKSVTGEQVKDAKTVTALTDDLKRTEPAMPSCPTGKRDSVLETSGRLGQAEAWYTKQVKIVKADVKKVLVSRDDKTLSDAQSVYDSSAGKVADENTRTQLKKALDGKDAKSAKSAADAVNASVQAKSEADQQAAAQAQAQAEAQQQAAQQAVQAQQQAAPGYAGGWRAPAGGYTPPARQNYNPPAPQQPQQSHGGSGINWDDWVAQHNTGRVVCHAGEACGI
ncbi:hypothetical protein, partial [Bifidobacterium bombi]|uniref:hypothetical protein n=1 Tax=Bifidobacterium bombi TaxID=471511 RepID=UPI00069443C4